jgi:uncharacterized membrane protein
MPSRSNIQRWLVITFFVAALVGFADASYLTAEHVRGTVPPCSVLEGCDRVLTSEYASIKGMPLAVLGMLYYGTVLVLLIAYFDIGNRRILHIASWLVAVGFLFTLFLVYAQVFIIEALCPYCLLSALASTVMFAIAARIMKVD